MTEWIYVDAYNLDDDIICFRHCVVVAQHENGAYWEGDRAIGPILAGAKNWNYYVIPMPDRTVAPRHVG